MKFFLWNNFTPDGLDRAILYLMSGSLGGGDDATQTTIRLGAGVSGSRAEALFPNGRWVHVQVGWLWGDAGTAYQRIWIDNNDIASPTAENRVFADLPGGAWAPGGPTGLDSQFFLGPITSTGACVREDALLDMMDFEVASAFDPTWYPSASPPSDGGVVIDAGPVDASAPSADSGPVVAADSGIAPSDAGAVAADAGSGPGDAGAIAADSETVARDSGRTRDSGASGDAGSGMGGCACRAASERRGAPYALIGLLAIGILLRRRAPRRELAQGTQPSRR